MKLPHNIEIENIVLGTIILEDGSYSKVEKVLTKDIFFDPKNKAIHQAIKELYTEGTVIDLITLVDKLKKLGKLEEAGGIVEVSQKTNSVASSAHFKTHTKLLYEYALKRHLFAILEDFKQKAIKDTTDPLKLVRELVNEFYEWTSIIQEGKEPIEIHQLIAEFYHEYLGIEQSIADGGSSLTGVETGNKKLNSITNGFQEGELTILAARPGMGKSVRAMNFLMDSNVSAIYFSLEMSERQIAQRCVASNLGISMNDLKGHRLQEHHKQEIDKFIVKMIDRSISVQTEFSRTIGDIRQDCKAHILKYGELDIIIIDYLQLITERGNGNDNSKIGRISKGLKHLSKEFNCPVIALSQLNRAVEQRPDKRPVMSDLRDSGNIEQDADNVYFIYRDSYYYDFGGSDFEGTEQEYKERSELIVAKSRQGERGVLYEKFIGEFATFRQYEEFNKAPF